MKLWIFRAEEDTNWSDLYITSSLEDVLESCSECRYPEVAGSIYMVDLDEEKCWYVGWYEPRRPFVPDVDCPRSVVSPLFG